MREAASGQCREGGRQTDRQADRQTDRLRQTVSGFLPISAAASIYYESTGLDILVQVEIVEDIL